jgi:hypothetical protein
LNIYYKITIAINKIQFKNAYLPIVAYYLIMYYCCVAYLSTLAFSSMDVDVLPAHREWGERRKKKGRFLLAAVVPDFTVAASSVSAVARNSNLRVFFYFAVVRKHWRLQVAYSISSTSSCCSFTNFLFADKVRSIAIYTSHDSQIAHCTFTNSLTKLRKV